MHRGGLRASASAVTIVNITFEKNHFCFTMGNLINDYILAKQHRTRMCHISVSDDATYFGIRKSKLRV